MPAYPHNLRTKYNLGSFFYLDIWPFVSIHYMILPNIDITDLSSQADPLLPVVDPDMCQQVALDTRTMKHPTLATFLKHLVGPGDIVSTDGEDWKKWRIMFNPGFATQHLMTLVPGIVSDAEIFISKLEKHVEAQDVFKLEEATTRLTIDIIGKA